ncbi:MAG: hypothetical protein LBL65_05390 [Campylobacteraceae bacterium]|nr:hypothetical protein [Campylobacteraceae bacterium]
MCIDKKSDGINIPYCHQIRNDIIDKTEFDNDAPIVKYRKRSDITFQEIIECHSAVKKSYLHYMFGQVAEDCLFCYKIIGHYIYK